MIRGGIALLLCCVLVGMCGCGGGAYIAKSYASQADELAVEAQVAFGQGKLQKGRDLLKMSLNYNRGTDRIVAVAQNLNDLGVLTMSAGDFITAKRYLEEALSLYESSADKAGILSAQLNLASLEVRGGDEKTALEQLKSIAQEAERSNLPAIAGSAHNQIAQSLAREKKYEEALSLFQKALELHYRAKAQMQAGISLHNLADVEIALGLYSQAREHLEKAIAIDKQKELWPSLGEDLFLTGRAWEGLKDSTQAARLYERAFYVYRFVGNPQSMDAAREAIKRVGGQAPLADRKD